MPGNGYWGLDIGYWVLGTGYWVLDAGLYRKDRAKRYLKSSILNRKWLMIEIFSEELKS
jgi:hypothetical protein